MVGCFLELISNPSIVYNCLNFTFVSADKYNLTFKDVSVGFYNLQVIIGNSYGFALFNSAALQSINITYNNVSTSTNLIALQQNVTTSFGGG